MDQQGESIILSDDDQDDSMPDIFGQNEAAEAMIAAPDPYSGAHAVYPYDISTSEATSTTENPSYGAVSNEQDYHYIQPSSSNVYPENANLDEEEEEEEEEGASGQIGQVCSICGEKRLMNVAHECRYNAKKKGRKRALAQTSDGEYMCSICPYTSERYQTVYRHCKNLGHKILFSADEPVVTKKVQVVERRNQPIPVASLSSMHRPAQQPGIRITNGAIQLEEHNNNKEMPRHNREGVISAFATVAELTGGGNLEHMIGLDDLEDDIAEEIPNQQTQPKKRKPGRSKCPVDPNSPAPKKLPDGQFQCNFCEFKSAKQTVVKHQWTHTNFYPYQCAACHKQLRQISQHKCKVTGQNGNSNTVLPNASHAGPSGTASVPASAGKTVSAVKKGGEAQAQNQSVKAGPKAARGARGSAPVDPGCPRPTRGEDGLFQCNFCVFKSKHSQSATVHQWRHTGFRPFKCHVCKKSFIQKSLLTKHVCRLSNPIFRPKIKMEPKTEPLDEPSRRPVSAAAGRPDNNEAAASENTYVQATTYDDSPPIIIAPPPMMNVELSVDANSSRLEVPTTSQAHSSAQFSADSAVSEAGTRNQIPVQSVDSQLNPVGSGQSIELSDMSRQSAGGQLPSNNAFSPTALTPQGPPYNADADAAFTEGNYIDFTTELPVEENVHALPEYDAARSDIAPVQSDITPAAIRMPQESTVTEPQCSQMSARPHPASAFEQSGMSFTDAVVIPDDEFVDTRPAAATSVTRLTQISPQMSPQPLQMPHQQMPHQQMSPQQMPPQQISQQQIPQRQMPHQQLPHQQMPPQQMPPQQIPPQQMPHQQMSPQQMPHQQMSPQQMSPQQMPHQQMSPQQMPPQLMPPQRMPPQQMLPQQMPPQQMPPQQISHQKNSNPPQVSPVHSAPQISPAHNTMMTQPTPTPTSNLYCCKLCKIYFEDEKMYRTHMDHHGPKIGTCVKCRGYFSTPLAFFNHMECQHKPSAAGPRPVNNPVPTNTPRGSFGGQRARSRGTRGRGNMGRTTVQYGANQAQSNFNEREPTQQSANPNFRQPPSVGAFPRNTPMQQDVSVNRRVQSQNPGARTPTAGQLTPNQMGHRNTQPMTQSSSGNPNRQVSPMSRPNHPTEHVTPVRPGNGVNRPRNIGHEASGAEMNRVPLGRPRLTGITPIHRSPATSTMEITNNAQNQQQAPQPYHQTGQNTAKRSRGSHNMSQNRMAQTTQQMLSQQMPPTSRNVAQTSSQMPRSTPNQMRHASQNVPQMPASQTSSQMSPQQMPHQQMSHQQMPAKSRNVAQISQQIPRNAQNQMPRASQNVPQMPVSQNSPQMPPQQIPNQQIPHRQMPPTSQNIVQTCQQMTHATPNQRPHTSQNMAQMSVTQTSPQMSHQEMPQQRMQQQQIQNQQQPPHQMPPTLQNVSQTSPQVTYVAPNQMPPQNTARVPLTQASPQMSPDQMPTHNVPQTSPQKASVTPHQIPGVSNQSASHQNVAPSKPRQVARRGRPLSVGIPQNQSSRSQHQRQQVSPQTQHSTGNMGYSPTGQQMVSQNPVPQQNQGNGPKVPEGSNVIVID